MISLRILKVYALCTTCLSKLEREQRNQMWPYTCIPKWKHIFTCEILVNSLVKNKPKFDVWHHFCCFKNKHSLYNIVYIPHIGVQMVWYQKILKTISRLNCTTVPTVESLAVPPSTCDRPSGTVYKSLTKQMIARSIKQRNMFKWMVFLGHRSFLQLYRISCLQILILI